VPPKREWVPGRAQIHLGPPGGVKEVGAQFLDRFANLYARTDQFLNRTLAKSGSHAREPAALNPLHATLDHAGAPP
jgi:hypothetical protein